MPDWSVDPQLIILMQDFEPKYEAQKIPELYNLYFDYQAIKRIIKDAKTDIKGKESYTNKFSW